MPLLHSYFNLTDIPPDASGLNELSYTQIWRNVTPCHRLHLSIWRQTA